MGFLNNIFGPKNKTEKKEKMIPEYHKCPMCGEMVKTNIKLYSDNPERYLDGEPKITIKELIDSHQFCEKCGYIYEGYDYEIYTVTAPLISDERRLIVDSARYQDVLHSNNIEPYYKKLLLYNFVNLLTNNNECDLYYEYQYHFDNNNIDKEQELLRRMLEGITDDCGTTVLGGTLYYNNKYMVEIGKTEIIVDILRRLGQFDEAKEKLVKYMDEYKKEHASAESQYEYFDFQLKLIEARDKRHI